MDTADGNSLGALSYYTIIVYSVFIIRSYVDLADITGRLTSCVANRPYLHCQGLYTEVLPIYLSSKRHIKSRPPDIWAANVAA